MNSDYRDLISRVGPKIRALRKEKNIKLLHLAQLTGMSSAMMSKIENGRIIPTLPKLIAIIHSLETSPEHFFFELNSMREDQQYQVIRSNEYQHYIKDEEAKGFYYELIAKRSGRFDHAQFSIVTLQPGNKRMKTKELCHEFIFVLKGTVDFHIADDVVSLHDGDAVFLDGKLPHVPLNKSDKEATLLVGYLSENEKYTSG